MTGQGQRAQRLLPNEIIAFVNHLKETVAYSPKELALTTADRLMLSRSPQSVSFSLRPDRPMFVGVYHRTLDQSLIAAVPQNGFLEYVPLNVLKYRLREVCLRSGSAEQYRRWPL